MWAGQTTGPFHFSEMSDAAVADSRRGRLTAMSGPFPVDADIARAETPPGSFYCDPAVYAAGRRMTVIATVTGAEERKIAELPYRYPVVAADLIKLWPREVLVPAYAPPWPYFYPWPYPYGWRYRGWGPGPYWW